MYRFFLLLALFLATSATATAQIHFFQGSWQQAKARAAAEGKLIFVDCYTTWCAPCHHMNRTVFADPSVGDYYNRHFICLKENMEGQLRADFRPWVEAYPTLLILNAEGYVIQKRNGAIFDPIVFIRFGAEARVR